MFLYFGNVIFSAPGAQLETPQKRPRIYRTCAYVGGGGGLCVYQPSGPGYPQFGSGAELQNFLFRAS